MDALCERIFLTRDARQTDDNLSFVRNRLLHTGEDDGNGKNDLAALLDRYRRIRAGQRIRDDETDPVCVTLQLSGVVKTDERGYLGVRNRIYDRVFDPEWVTTHLPGAETRRQQAAFSTRRLTDGGNRGGGAANRGDAGLYRRLSGGGGATHGAHRP